MPTNQIKRIASDEIKVQPKKMMINHCHTNQRFASFTTASSLIKKSIDTETGVITEALPIPDISNEELLMMAKSFEDLHKD